MGTGCYSAEGNVSQVDRGYRRTTFEFTKVHWTVNLPAKKHTRMCEVSSHSRGLGVQSCRGMLGKWSRSNIPKGRELGYLSTTTPLPS